MFLKHGRVAAAFLHDMNILPSDFRNESFCSVCCLYHTAVSEDHNCLADFKITDIQKLHPLIQQYCLLPESWRISIVAFIFLHEFPITGFPVPGFLKFPILYYPLQHILSFVCPVIETVVLIFFRPELFYERADQSSMELGTIISDIHKILTGEEYGLTYIYKLE